MDIDLVDFAAIVALAETLHFGRAADRLRFRRSHPDVQLQLRDMSTPDQVEGLAAGEIDIGFVRLPVVGDRLVVRPVLDERLVLAIGPRSPWKARIGLRSVAAEPFIIIARSRSASFYDHALMRAPSRSCSASWKWCGRHV